MNEDVSAIGVVITNNQPNISLLGILSSLQVSGNSELVVVTYDSLQISGDIPLIFGNNAGKFEQGTFALAIGNEAGQKNQGSGAIAIGFQSATTNQGFNAISIGNSTSKLNQGNGSIAIGSNAGSQQSNNSIIISAQGSVVTANIQNATFISPLRFVTQTNVISYNTTTKEISYFNYTPSGGSSSLINGTVFGQTINWNDSTITWQITGAGPLALGNFAGQSNQGTSSIAIGFEAGRRTQGSGSIAIGYQSGLTQKGTNSLSIGIESGKTTQGMNSIAIGFQSGFLGQTSGAIAIGFQTGLTGQRTNAIAIGVEAGENSQGLGSISIGLQSNQWFAGTNSIAIGIQAGITNSGSGSICIGNLSGSRPNVNAIVISASGSRLTGAAANATYIAPVRYVSQSNIIGYNSTINELTYYNSSAINTLGLTSTVLFYSDFTRAATNTTLSSVQIYTNVTSVNTGSAVNVNWVGSNWLSGSSNSDSVGTYYTQLTVPSGMPSWLTVFVGGYKCSSIIGQARISVYRPSSNTTVFSKQFGSANENCNQFLVPFLYNDFRSGDVLTFGVTETNTILTYEQITSENIFPAGRLFIRS